jgi:cell division protein FtsW
MDDLRWGLGGFAAILALPTALLLAQPDNGTLGIILFSAGAMYLAAGARVRDIAILVLTGILMMSVVLFVRPYALDRMTTFLDPSKDPLTTGYQLRQSLIAVGSGGVFGRGFGQSIQKFNYLPEPVSDSIFAVAAEEFGILGAIILIALYMLFAARGLFIASRTPDYFGALLAVGITVYIVMQAFINIASMIGVMPMTGVPLVFVSHGGTAMLTALGAAGILLSISRRSQQN